MGLRFTLIVFAIAAGVFALGIRGGTLGANFIVFGLGFLAICVIHVVVHTYVAVKRNLVPPTVVAAAISNAALLGAFLLQWDRDLFAHGKGGDLVLTAILAGEYWQDAPGWWPPSWWPNADGHEFLVSVVVSWFLLRRAGPRTSLREFAAPAAVVAVPAIVLLAVSSSMTFDRVRAESEAIQAAGGRTPTGCGSAPIPQLRTSLEAIDGALGAEQVWLDLDDKGMRGPRMEVRARDVAFHGLGQLSRDGRPPVAFMTMWIMSPENTDIVRIRITDLASGQPVRILNGAENGESLDPSTPSIKSGRESFLGRYSAHYRYIHLTHTGCYTLEASWPGGSWTIGLAVGE